MIILLGRGFLLLPGHDYLLPYRDDDLHKQVIRTMVNIIVTGTESSRSSL